MAFRHDGAAIGAGDGAEAALDQRGGGFRGAAGAAAEPQHRPFGAGAPASASASSCAGSGLRALIVRQAVQGSAGTILMRWTSTGISSVTGPAGAVSASRAAAMQRVDGGGRLPDPQVGLADGLEHVRLARHVVDRRAVAIDEFAIDLRGDVQHRRAGGQRFDLRAGGIAGRGAGAGDDDAKRARHPRIGVGHVHGAGLAARRHETDSAVPRDGVENRHVVDRDHAENRRHADVGKRACDGVADRLGRHRWRRGAAAFGVMTDSFMCLIRSLNIVVTRRRKFRGWRR